MEISFILTNGKIYSMEGKTYEAVAISGDRIVKLGTDAEIKAMGSMSTLKIDLKGKSVFPGFNDSHLHLQIRGANRNSVDLQDAKSIKDIIEKTRRFMIRAEKKPGEWISGWGWDQSDFGDDCFPTKDDLDKVSTENPIVIIRTCHHIGVMNSMAIKIVGAANETAVSGGTFDKDRNGNLNGVFREGAMSWVFERIPKPNLAQIKNDLYTGIEEALRYGITSLQTSDLHDGILFDDMFEAFSSLKKEKRLKARINEQLYLPDKEKLMDFLGRGYQPSEGDSLFKLGPVKLVLDGSLGARTAALADDYSDNEGNKGNLFYEQEELDELVRMVHDRNLQLSLHAIGDAAIKSGIDAIEKAVLLNPREHRHRINHVQITTPELIGRMAKLGIIADIQPVFVSSDWHIAESRIGAARAKTSYVWKSMLEAGITLAGGSDAPVESLNPMLGIYAAVTRKGWDGEPEDGWMPEQKLSVQEAMELFTKNPAYASFEENEKGTLSEGNLADMTILSEDPFEVELDNIKDIEVLTTILGGEIVYSEV